MAVETDETTPAAGESSNLSGSNYDIIRARLEAQAAELRRRCDALNTRRQELFGSTRMEVVGQSRIRTENACVPQDIVPLGGRLLFGYHVSFGLKQKTAVEDVFSLHRFTRGAEGFAIEALPQESAENFLSERGFVADFDEIFTYYKDVRLRQLRRNDARLFASLQLGGDAGDLRILRWGIEGDDVGYIDNAGHLEHALPAQHDFDWIPTTREAHVRGKHPHVSILDEVFVETVGGDLTIKIEDNTESGQGILAEAVDDPRQSLNDAEYQYVPIGELILLRILPYREKAWRYYAFNRLTRTVVRMDAIGLSCKRLPEEQGIMVPGGYVLSDGTSKRFDGDMSGMELQEVVRAPNGEDLLYVYHRPADGHYVLQAYNLIRKEVQTPITCHGYSVFDDGAMIVFRFQGQEPTRVHPMQIWRTPFCSDEHAASQPTGSSPLANIGNAELVRGISDCFSLCRMIADQTPSVAIYEALVASASRVADNYFWLSKEEAGAPKEVVDEIARTAELVIDEFQKVQALREEARDALADAEQVHRGVMRDVRYGDWAEVQRFVDGLAALRRHRGHLITLQEVRYIDVARLEAMEAEAVEHFDRLSRATVDFLLGDGALDGYRDTLEAVAQGVDEVETTPQVAELRESLDGVHEALTLLTEIAGALQVDDPTRRTRMLENIGEILGQQNRARALLETRSKRLLEREGKAEFAVQFQLLGQTVTSALSMASTPERVDEALTRVMVQLEEMESRFSVFDGFLAQLAEKREEIWEVFEAKKQALLEERQRQAQNTAQAAERILTGVERRAKSLGSVDDLNAYFASDAMITKVRDLIAKLRGWGEEVRADDLDTRLKATRDGAIRQLRDRLDLFVEGENVIRFGRHRFSVQSASAELTMVPRDGVMSLHITGTDFYEVVDDPDFQETRPFWDQHLVSETDAVYRGEYLAACLLFDAQQGARGHSMAKLHEGAHDPAALLRLVRRELEDRYDEGYERGVHDADAARILERVVSLYETAGLLRFSAAARGLAALFWAHGLADVRERLGRRAVSLGRLRQTYAHGEPFDALAADLAAAIGRFAEGAGLEEFEEPETGLCAQAGRYLAEELVAESPKFVASGGAVDFLKRFREGIDRAGARPRFEEDLSALLTEDLAEARRLAVAWLRGWAGSADARDLEGEGDVDGLVTEAATLLLCEGRLEREISSARVEAQVEGLLGTHPRIVEGRMTIRLDAFLERLRLFGDEHVPAYRRYRRRAHALLERERERLRLDELEPKVLSSFVRNRLIDEVYLPLIGDNLARQIGAAGEEGRSDRSGLLLLVSPPGYGKTTLMEYVASRLGLMFMKINGPSLGHDVVSLDPDQAPNATARQEVEKVNLALEMGNNVLLYVDDIQHTNPEFLQKFISLCDATRRIEGVWKGRTRTYDLRGKRFGVVMAGNPYTESGDRFVIPDMLANRADTYNLGDILAGKEEVFELSYVENALTANPVTADLATRDRKDVDRFLRLARGVHVPLTEFEHGYNQVEAAEIVDVLRKMMQVRDVVLTVNKEYVASAAMKDDYRVEPPFQLQGSYRNMNKMVDKLASAMNEAEVERVVDNHYRNESQTLTTGAEQNLLKLEELRGTLTPERRARWEAIKAEFRRRKMLGGGDDDPIARVAGPLTGLVQGLEEMQGVLASSPLGGHLSQIHEALEALAAAASAREAPAEAAVELDAPATQLAAAGQVGALDRAATAELTEALHGLRKAQLSVHLAGDLPRRLQETMEHQLAIIESTLVPLAKALHDQNHQNDRTNAALDQVLRRLEAVGKRRVE